MLKGRLHLYKISSFIHLFIASVNKLLYKSIRIRQGRKIDTVWGRWPQQWEVELIMRPSRARGRRSRKGVVQDGNILSLMTKKSGRCILSVSIIRYGTLLGFYLPTKTVRSSIKLSLRSYTTIKISTRFGTSSRSTKRKLQYLVISVNDRIVCDEPVRSFGKGKQFNVINSFLNTTTK